MRPEDLPDGWFWLAPTMTGDQSSGYVQSRTPTVSGGPGSLVSGEEDSRSALQQRIRGEGLPSWMKLFCPSFSHAELL